MGIGRATREQHPIRMFPQDALDRIAKQDVAGVQIQLVVDRQQFDRFVRQAAILRVAAEPREHDREIVFENELRDGSGGKPPPAADDHRRADVCKHLEDLRFGEPVPGGIQQEAVEAVVVGVLFDVLRVGVVRLPTDRQIPDPADRGGVWHPRAAKSGERQERTIDAEAGGSVVQPEIPPRFAGAGCGDRPDDSRLVELSFQPLGGDVPPPLSDRFPIRIETDTHVHDPEPVLQFQHRLWLLVPDA